MGAGGTTRTATVNSRNRGEALTLQGECRREEPTSLSPFGVSSTAGEPEGGLGGAWIGDFALHPDANGPAQPRMLTSALHPTEAKILGSLYRSMSLGIRGHSGRGRAPGVNPCLSNG